VSLSPGLALVGVLLLDDGYRLQSPKRRVFLIKDRRWIMSKICHFKIVKLLRLFGPYGIIFMTVCV
jgi:hypothetical protein